MHWIRSVIERLKLHTSENILKEAHQATDCKYAYARAYGGLTAHYKEAVGTVIAAEKELAAKALRIESLEWAIEVQLNDTDCSSFDNSLLSEKVFEAAQIIENAMKSGMTTEQLREHFRGNSDGLSDEEFAQKRLISKSEQEAIDSAI